jgi:filamentous hemagglutinin
LTTVDSSTQVQPQLNLQAAPDLQQQAVNPLALPGFSLPQGESGLFKVSSDPQHKYLIETNPAFANLKQFLNSDYLLSRIGFNRDQTQRRLGDGFYEQRLIREALIARTGQRFIAGLDSDEAMFRYLMDNAIVSKTALELSPGVALTSAQIAALTHDIVWMQEQEVNGEKVLVPVLYMAQAHNRLAPNGALIQGRDLNLISGGTLANQGTLRASTQLQARAQNIDNSGLIEANERLSLLARQSIRNAQGGILKGQDVSLVATEGDVINERSKVRLDTGYGSGRQHNDYLNSAARVEADNRLDIAAGRDIRNSGSVLQAMGDMSLKAGRDLTLVATEQVNTSSGRHKKTSWSQSRTAQYGSEVTTGGNLAASAGVDVTIVASTLKAVKDIDLRGEGDVRIASAANEDSSAYHKKRGGKKVDIEHHQVRQQSSVIEAGGELVVGAGGDLLVSSSHLKSGADAYLYAGEQIALLAAQDSNYSLYNMKKKGSWGSKKTKRDEVTDERHMGSSITSGENLTLNSDGDQTYQVAKLESGKDITLDGGGAITFEGVKDLHQESHEKTNNNSFWVSSKGKGNTDETLRQTQILAAGNIVIKAVYGLKIDVRQVNQQTVSQSINAMVNADPQLAWLKEAEKRGDVDWRVVKEIHDSYKYSNSGLGPASQIIIAIVMAAVVGPAAMGAMGTATGGAVAAGTISSGTAGMLVSGAGAIATGAATNATVSFINNGGNLGAVVKDVTSSNAIQGYVISGVTAGLTTGYFDKWVGGKTDVLTGKVDLQLDTWTGVGKFAANQTLQGGTSTLLSKALGQGGSANDALKSALFNTLAAVSFNAVGDYSLGVFAEGSLPKVAIHAMVGGLLSEATGGDFKAGALAAGASEALAVELGQLVKNDESLLVMSSQIVGVLAAASQKDADAQSIEKGRWVAQQAMLYNNLNHAAAEKLLKEIKDCRVAGGCSENKFKSILGKYETLSAERSNAINACSTRACVDKILSSSVRMDDPVSQELLGLLRQTTYDTPGLLQGNPDLVSWQSPNPSGWGDTFALDKQQAFAKSLKEGWLTPHELADLDRWNDSTSWVDRSVGQKLEPKEKASILLELGTTAAMALMGGRGSVGAGGGKSGIQHVYDSIKSAPKFPEGFRERVGGTTKNVVNNKAVLDDLRRIEAGRWTKVYKDGFDSNGVKISVHYFQSESGKVFDVKAKPSWSNNK